jgi:hypothetical protein
MQYYGPAIIKDSGFQTESNDTLLWCMIVVAGFMIGGNIACISLSKKYGRRQLVLACTMPMALATCALTLAIAINGFKEDPGTFKCKLKQPFELLSSWRMDRYYLNGSFHVLLFNRLCDPALDHLLRDLPSKLQIIITPYYLLDTP